MFEMFDKIIICWNIGGIFALNACFWDNWNVNSIIMAVYKVNFNCKLYNLVPILKTSKIKKNIPSNYIHFEFSFKWSDSQTFGSGNSNSTFSAINRITDKTKSPMKRNQNKKKVK